MKQLQRIFLVTIVGLLFCVGIVSAAKEIYIQAKIYIENKADWAELKTMGLDIVYRGDNYIEIVTHDEELSRIRELGIKTEIVHEDVSAFLRSRLPDKAMGSYRTLSEIYAYIDSIIAENPTLVSNKVKIGETYEGRDLWAFKISDNPNVDEDEPEVLYTSAIHCREVITPEVLMHFINYILNNYGFDHSLRDLINSRELWFVLVVNPDGYYYNEVTDPNGGGMWRKNRMPYGGSYGVDLNRNFGYEWGYDDDGSSPSPSSDTYRGPSAFSELETQALRDFALAHNFVISMYYHSYSNLVLWPWGYDEITTPDDDIFSIMGDSLAYYNGYDPGPIWTLYVVNGGTDDWYYGEQSLKPKTFAMSIEVGDYSDNFWPPASRIPTLVAENLGANLFLAKVAGNVYSFRAPEAPVVTVADTVPAVEYTVSWTHDDTLNPAVEFELVESQGYTMGENTCDSFDGMINNGFSLSSARYSSPSSSFYSGSGNNLNNSFRTTDPYSVTAGDSLIVKVWYAIEDDWDYAYAAVSTDGTSFTSLAGNITTNYDPNGENLGNGITGSSSGWITAKFDLSGYVGQSVYFRFSYVTDSYVDEEGIYIDDIYPYLVFASETAYTGITEMSYTFTAQDTGTYFYRVRAIDAEGQIGAYSSVVETYALANIECGDVSGDGSVGIGDAVFLVNLIFRGGPAPISYNASDVNSDGFTNVADAVYIINYIFKGGPAPNCPE
ncbi:MAG: M14 family zinc carboxypeptidase [Candidatus Zixiibacteriota bacterium]